ncbi:condensation domain-containing protein [Streptomyces chartreusis]|uniref:condensation domain-containing protein n=1 Tax=Streptomyces chartreusis TaxID=1969 RepID=UPI003819F9BF
MARPGVHLPLTSAQQGIWTGQQLDPSSARYNAAEYVRIDGPLDIIRFEKALRQTVSETEAVQVIFEANLHGVAQRFKGAADWRLPIVDASCEENPWQYVLTWMLNDLETVVDLEEGPLFAHALFALESDCFVWYHRAHHIALDGYGFYLFASRVAELYTSGRTKYGLSRAWFGSLRDAIAEDVTFRNSPEWDTHRDFWSSHLEDLPIPPVLAKRPSTPSDRIFRSVGSIPTQASSLWQTIAHRTGATWVEVVLALTVLYVHQQSMADEIILGLPVMGRLGSTTARTPMMNVNVVPVRVPIGTGAKLSEIVLSVSRELRTIRPHHRYRVERLRHDLRLRGARHRMYGPSVNIIPFDRKFDFDGHRAHARNLAAGVGFLEDSVIHLYPGTGIEQGVLQIDANADCYDQCELQNHLGNLVRVFSRDHAPLSS